MTWELCIQYANGTEKTIQSYPSRELALNHVDQLYSKWGYPLHFAYIVRPKVGS